MFGLFVLVVPALPIKYRFVAGSSNHNTVLLDNIVMSGTMKPLSGVVCQGSIAHV